MPTRSVPAEPSASAAMSARAASRRATIASACPSSRRPASVGSTRRGPPGRWKRRCPTIRSSCAICWLTADWVYPSSRAARPKERVRATASRAAKWRSSTPSQSLALMIETNDNSTCADRWRSAPWSHEDEDRHRARDRLRRLGIDISRDRRRRPDTPAAAHARRPLRPRRWAPLRVVRLAGRCRLGAAGPARVDGRHDRRRAAPLRRHGRHRVGRAAGCLGPDRAPRGDGAAVHGAARPHLLRSPPLARRARRHRRGTARRRAARRPERKRRSGRRRGDPRGGARLGGGLGLRPRCTAAAGAVSIGRDANALRGRTAGDHGNRNGRGGPRASRGDLRGLGRRVPLPRRLRLDRGVHRVRLAAAERCAERPRLDVCLRQSRGCRRARVGPRRRGRRRPRARGRRDRRRLGRDARPGPGARPARGGGAAARDGRPVSAPQGGAGAPLAPGCAAARRPAPHGPLSDRAAPRYGGGMTTFDLRTLRIRSGDQTRERVEIELEPLLLAGQEYEPRPNPAPAELTVTRASSGTVLELTLDVSLHGPCFRCLEDAELALQLRLREYQSTKPESDDERTEYLEDDRLDLSAWARDAIALALPDQILCRPDCAGLCPVCGKDLNLEPHEHVEERVDPRWEALSRLREE